MRVNRLGMRRLTAGLAGTLVVAGSALASASAPAVAAAPIGRLVAPAPRAASAGQGLGIGQPRGMVPRLGTTLHTAAGTKASSTNPYCPGCNPPLVYNSASPVMGGLSGTPGHVTITPVYWAPSGYSFTSTYKSVINGYIQNVAAASGQSTNVFSVSTQYYQQYPMGSPVQHIQYAIQAGTEVDDTTTFPANGGSTGCNPDATFTGCVTDGALSTELKSLATTKSLPVDDSHLYVVMFPPAVETCFQPGTAGPTNPCSTNVYCAYHSGVGPPYLIYANEPYPDLNHCSGGQAPNGDSEADAQVSLISHEANEAMTDSFGAWMDSAQFENGDECAYVYGAPLGGSSGTFYNQVIGSGHYFTQDEFSNEDYAVGAGDSVSSVNPVKVAGCVQRDELPTASFTGPSTVAQGLAAAFNGSASSDPDNSAALTFAWDWGDGSAAGTGATPSHIFASGGTYTVTLTVTDVDGWSGSVAHPITVSTGLQPTVSSIAPSNGPQAGGTSVTITGTGFTGVNAVAFGASPATTYTLNSTTQITATSPAGTGAVDVTVTTANGTSLTSSADVFSYTSSLSYFSWYDHASPGMLNDNVHLVNPGSTPANVTVSLPGAVPKAVAVAPGGETYVTFPTGTIGGPVTVSANQPILASQRVQYYQTFNEVWAQSSAQSATNSYINWYDKASPGMFNDNIHLLNPGTSSTNVTVSLPGAVAQTVIGLAGGAETYVTFPKGSIGGPVTISSTQPVLASQRVQYYSSFNEVWAEGSAQAATTSYVNWYDKASAGMYNDNIHLLNPGGAVAHVTVNLPGATAQTATVAVGGEAYVSFPAGSIGGPVTITSDVAILSSQRVQYYSTFNEVWAESASQATMSSHLTWYDRASPGMNNDNIHLLNPGASSAMVTVSLPGATSQMVTVAAGAEAYVSFPAGSIGGPVTVSSTQPVLAAQRVQYYSSFNEIWAD